MFVIFTDDKGLAFNEITPDVNAAYLLHAGLAAGDSQAISSRDLATRIGGDRKTTGAVIRIGGELIEALDAIFGNPNDGGTGFAEPLLDFGKGVGLDIAAARRYRS